jgi:hypothetical protein
MNFYNDPLKGGFCVDQVNGYYCMCPGNRVGLDCQNTIVDPCTADNFNNDRQYHELPNARGNVYLQCTAESQWAVRKCPESLFWHQEEKTCTIERPMLKSGMCSNYPCKNGGQCEPLGAGQFKCVCKSGFTGELCEQMIDYCLSNPCQSGGRCLSFAGGYVCSCPDKIIDDCCCNGMFVCLMVCLNQSINKV